MTIYIYEPIDTLAHEPYIRGFLGIAESIDNIELSLASEKALPGLHATSLRKILRFKAFQFGSRLSCCLMHLRFVRFARKKGGKNIFLSFNNVSMFFACLCTLNRRRLHIVCHNNFRRAQGSVLSCICFRLLKYFNVQLVLLDDFFQKEAKAVLGFQQKDLAVVYPVVEARKKERFKPETTIISYLSGAVLDKGFDVFIQAIAQYFQMFRGPQKLAFKIKLSPEVDLTSLGVAGDWLAQYPVQIYRERLTQDAYYTLLASSSYICLPFRNSFSNSVSQVALEAISARVPLIVSPLPLFEYYFQEYGKLGEVLQRLSVESLVQIFLKLNKQGGQDAYPGLEYMALQRGASVVKEQLKRVWQA